MKRVIHWFRRDLRLSDNAALHHAVSRAEEVIPVFILEEALSTGPDVGAARLQFLLDSVRELQASLASKGYTLVVRRGRSEHEIPALARELKADAVFANVRYEPYAQARDARIFNALNEIRVGFELFKDAVIWHEQEILTKAGKPFTVFTPYARTWKARRIPAPFPALPPQAAKPASKPGERIPSVHDFGHECVQESFPAGESAGSRALNDFVSGPVFSYGTNRNLVSVDGTSRLSPHLRAGTIGIRAVLAAVNKARAQASGVARESCDTFVDELIWREFYLQVLRNFPHVMRGAFRPDFNDIAWSADTRHLDAWRAGQTGYPIVDAAMRCLNKTGWMHNRLRMITAMFLTKDLLLNWQEGERYFMKQLVDGDMAANNGGWQWSAGTGTDAAPYFRIFNPTTQAEKCDPEGEFVRQWIPELAAFKGAAIHQPWKEPLLARAYAPRVVLHEEQRPRTLAAFAAAGKRDTRR